MSQAKRMWRVFIHLQQKWKIKSPKVLDTDIATGNITVFNRETKRVEIVPYKEKRTLYENIHKLAVNTQELDCGY